MNRSTGVFDYLVSKALKVTGLSNECSAVRGHNTDIFSRHKHTQQRISIKKESGRAKNKQLRLQQTHTYTHTIKNTSRSMPQTKKNTTEVDRRTSWQSRSCLWLRISHKCQIHEPLIIIMPWPQLPTKLTLDEARSTPGPSQARTKHHTDKPTFLALVSATSNHGCSTFCFNIYILQRMGKTKA